LDCIRKLGGGPEQSVVLREDREGGLYRKSANVLEVFFVDPAQQFEDADPVLRCDSFLAE
jgi:hypothetical protein